MHIWREIEVEAEGQKGLVYLTDDVKRAKELQRVGKPVVIYLHEGNKGEDSSGLPYAVEGNLEDFEQDYFERIFRRFLGLPWNILETKRLLVRETTPEDVEAFYEIYADPSITAYMENLFPDPSQEKEYIRSYIENVYHYYEIGIWTVIEKKTGKIIGRAGLEHREGFDDVEMGYVIGVPWQGKGYALEVCEAILLYAREQLQFDTVQAFMEPENTASVELCKKLGFTLQDTLLLDGKLHNWMKKKWISE